MRKDKTESSNYSQVLQNWRSVEVQSVVDSTWGQLWGGGGNIRMYIVDFLSESLRTQHPNGPQHQPLQNGDGEWMALLRQCKFSILNMIKQYFTKLTQLGLLPHEVQGVEVHAHV